MICCVRTCCRCLPAGDCELKKLDDLDKLAPDIIPCYHRHFKLRGLQGDNHDRKIHC